MVTTKRRAWSWSNLFNTQMVFLKEFFEKVDFEKIQQTTKKHEKFPREQRVKGGFSVYAISTKTLCAGSFGLVWLEMEISSAGLKDFFHYCKVKIGLCLAY